MINTIRIGAFVLLVTLPTTLFAKVSDLTPPKTRIAEGAVVGAGIGITLGATTDAIIGETVDAKSNARAVTALILIPVGAALIGAGIGALIGHSIPYNEKYGVYPAPLVDPVTGAKGLMLQGSF